MRFALVLVLIAACGKRQPPDPAELVDAGPPTNEQLAELKTEALAKVNPFEGYPEYVLSDPPIVDPCMTKALKATTGDFLRPSVRRSIVDEAAHCIEWSAMDPEGMALLEKKIADRYAHPVITLHDTVAKIDMGVVPGRLKKGFKRPLDITESPHLEDYQWTTSEVVRALRLAMAKYPTARTFRADAVLASYVYGGKWHYVYDQTGDVIRVYDPGERLSSGAWITKKLGGNLNHVPSLKRSDLAGELGPKVPLPE